jgi:AraC family transcriptional regulator of adaptative response / DNA-3-methyladenine glycosylase II
MTTRALDPVPRDRVRLPVLEPYDFDHWLAFQASRALPGLEAVTPHEFRRRFLIDGVPGELAIQRAHDGPALAVTITAADPTVRREVLSRARRMLDIDRDPIAIGAVLRKDPQLRALVRRFPGQRIPGAFDPFELAVRAVLGQQVSVAAARTVAARVIERHGAPIAGSDGARYFPTPEALADAEIEACGVIRQRSDTIRGIARGLLHRQLGFVHDRPEAFVAEWTMVRGIGDWTAQYIAMRALGLADAFPAGDLILRRAASTDGSPLSERQLRERAEAWRPYRAYSVFLLWRSLG